MSGDRKSDNSDIQIFVTWIFLLAAERNYSYHKRTLHEFSPEKFSTELILTFISLVKVSHPAGYQNSLDKQIV